MTILNCVQFQMLTPDAWAWLIMCEIGSFLLGVYIVKRMEPNISNYRLDCALFFLLPLVLWLTLVAYWIMGEC
jgi:hypothetical protein